MGDTKIFRIKTGKIEELPGFSVALEKGLQTLIENNLEIFLGIKFLASEYSTGKTHVGRIDTLGIDENGYPVIIEYKRSLNENVINQGLFYLDWLLDHKAEFELLVQKQCGRTLADTIEWSKPRLLCIAGDFTKYDPRAVSQIGRNIELIKYCKYNDELLLLEQVNSVVAAEIIPESNDGRKKKTRYTTVMESLANATPEIKELFENIKQYLLALGDDVQFVTLKYYFAFKRIKNFVCMEVHPQTRHIILFVKVDLDSIKPEKGFTRDVRNIGHFGTGNLEITIADMNDFNRAKIFIDKSYEAN
ncbi:MAG: DUF5655 domain-containing protein [Victivallaceae bacterium]|nr:DUF5655 domain-containing protein [Victivallaceae bacterium]